MTKRWRIHQETLAEIDATVAWYEEQRPGLGLEFLDELRSTLAVLREAPTTVSTPDPVAPSEALARRRRVGRFPYAVVFAEGAHEYVVIGVMHLRRRPGYWLSRLDERG
jgi:toxin ParE1/3/4